MRRHRIAFPDKRTEIHQLVAEGDLVVAYSTTRATHTGPYFDLEPTGKQVVIREFSMHRIVEGRIAETWVVDEGGGFYWQLTGRDAPQATDNMG